ncbi:MAG: glycine/sarcosine/betaine reductase complex component C subunit beta [Syntrophaceticus sp.]|nr:glycine/sarcosine/betaine reductase complex component C subunit beta [Syntrophaceticus sp.]
MNFPVIKGAAYTLIQANDLLLYQGTTQTIERRNNPQSEHLQKLPEHMRSFEDAVSYPPNQTYIGNILPDDLRQIPRPWFENSVANASRQGRFGEIMPEDEFYGLMKVVDSFELVILDGTFQAAVKEKLLKHPVLNDIKDIGKLDKDPESQEKIENLVAEHDAQPLYFEGKLVGCVKKAHQFDEALSSEVMLGNLANKASSVLTVKLLLDRTDLNPKDVEYIIDCSEEACGDMNQRGGGNFAKAIGELCGFVNATGSDTRSFCAGPSHALVEAAALVQSGIYSDVIVVGGGCTAKLGMNSRDHVKKGLPALEDMLGAFAVHIAENDGKSPVIRTDAIGRHTIGSGASPQAVMTAIVTDPLDKIGYKITDVDRYAPEMQNPEITEPAGAGNVPMANYKMISALGVKRKEIDRKELMQAVDSFGMPGYAPTQGHIPSGVPFIGYARDMIMDGRIDRVMIIGKGSLFLGRLTNLFDGVSLLIEKNSGVVDTGDTGFDQEGVRKVVAEAMREFAKTLKE